MRLAIQATIIIDMPHPERYGRVEPTSDSLKDMIQRGECDVDMPELYDKPVYIFKQKEDL